MRSRLLRGNVSWSLRRRNGGSVRTDGLGVPPAAPGSGFGSVGEQTTLANGVETPTILLLGSRPFGPKSLTRGSAPASASSPDPRISRRDGRPPSNPPAIFLYLDPDLPAAKFGNTVAHELHHVGVGSMCPADPDSKLPRGLRDALAWMGGFAEGRAVLAAAGGPGVHPHAASGAAERAVWERSAGLASAERDVRRMEEFFLELLDGGLPEEEQNRRGMALVVSDGVPQGPFYTVGWLMAAAVDRRLGRERLVVSLCDPRMFLVDYQRAARAENRSAPEPLPLWSDELLRRIGVR